MKGTRKSRKDLGKGSHGLRFRCPRCKVVRKHDIMDTNQGGEGHASPEPQFVEGEGRVCGWCLARAAGLSTFQAERENGETVTRDVKSGRVLR